MNWFHKHFEWKITKRSIKYNSFYFILQIAFLKISAKQKRLLQENLWDILSNFGARDKLHDVSSPFPPRKDIQMLLRMQRERHWRDLHQLVGRPREKYWYFFLQCFQTGSCSQPDFQHPSTSFSAGTQHLPPLPWGLLTAVPSFSLSSMPILLCWLQSRKEKEFLTTLGKSKQEPKLVSAQTLPRHSLAAFLPPPAESCLVPITAHKATPAQNR